MSDKFPTNAARNPEPEQSQPTPSNGRSKQRKPFQVVRFLSVNIPVYAFEHHGKIRYTIAFYLNGGRQRREFTDLEVAKREAKLAASEDYVQCRKLLGNVPLRQAVEDFCRRTLGVKLGVKVPEVAQEVIAAKEEDGMSGDFLVRLRSPLGIFGLAFPGPIMDPENPSLGIVKNPGRLLIVGLRQRLQDASFCCHFVWIEGSPFLRTPRVWSPHHPSKDCNGVRDASFVQP